MCGPSAIFNQWFPPSTDRYVSNSYKILVLNALPIFPLAIIIPCYFWDDNILGEAILLKVFSRYKLRLQCWNSLHYIVFPSESITLSLCQVAPLLKLITVSLLLSNYIYVIYLFGPLLLKLFFDLSSMFAIYTKSIDYTL